MTTPADVVGVLPLGGSAGVLGVVDSAGTAGVTVGAASPLDASARRVRGPTAPYPVEEESPEETIPRSAWNFCTASSVMRP